MTNPQISRPPSQSRFLELTLPAINGEDSSFTDPTCLAGLATNRAVEALKPRPQAEARAERPPEADTPVLNPEALRPTSYIPTVSGLPDSGACELKGSKVLNPEALRPTSYIPTVSGLPDSGACELKSSNLNPEALRPASYIPTVSGLPDSGACELKSSKSVAGYPIPLSVFPMRCLHPARRGFYIQNSHTPYGTWMFQTRTPAGVGA